MATHFIVNHRGLAITPSSSRTVGCLCRSYAALPHGRRSQMASFGSDHSRRPFCIPTGFSIFFTAGI